MHPLSERLLLLAPADGAGLRGFDLTLGVGTTASRVPASCALYASFCKMPCIPLRPAFLLPPWADIGLTRKVSVAMSP